MKKTVALFLSLMMVMLAACSPSLTTPTQTQTPTSVSESTTNPPEAKFSFPPAERKTFKIMGISYQTKPITESQFYQKMLEETNVAIDYVLLGSSQDEAVEKLNLLFASNDAGDAIMGGNAMNETHISLYAQEGFLAPLNKYIENPEIMPVFNNRVLAVSPETTRYITFPDGNIYSLPRVNQFFGAYLESPLLINKKWLDAAGLGIPATIAELEAVFDAFLKNDMNGNGNPDDEIPLLLLNGTGSQHWEAWLGMWGLPTKDGTFESYVTIKNGVVKFVPMMDEYKEAIKVFNRWYEKGYVWQECFTGSMQTFNSIFNDKDVCRFGLTTAKNIGIDVPWRDEFIAILPPSIEGYDTVWFLHPGIYAIKNQFSLTTACKEPEYLMRWVDTLYTLEYSLESFDGVANKEGRLAYENGKYKYLTGAPEFPTFRSFFENALPVATLNSDYEKYIELSPAQEDQLRNGTLYKDILNPEPWPRPYFAEEDASRMNELRTDIFNTVNKYKASWITGQSSIDSDWDNYIKSLKAMGIDEFISIMQKTYDAFMANK